MSTAAVNSGRQVESYLETWSPARRMPATRQHDSGRVPPLARRDVGECVGPACRLWAGDVSK